MTRLRKEFEVFLRCSRSMQILMVSNMIYALVLPVIEIFVAAYVMRNSRAVARVVTYQLAIYAATPLAFYLNGRLLGKVGAKHLYAAGMLLSGLAMMLMMQLSILTSIGVATSGFFMGLATGLFWANRGYLALTATNDGNRNYYYGLEMFVASLASVAVPALIGWFISGTTLYGWLGGIPNRAYHIVAAVVFGLTILAAGILERGTFRDPQPTPFVFFHFHPLWIRMLELALLKGLAQGYIVTAPAMLIMLLVRYRSGHAHHASRRPGGNAGRNPGHRWRGLCVRYVSCRPHGGAQASHLRFRDWADAFLSRRDHQRRTL
jgi:YQGE family putative transporter